MNIIKDIEKAIAEYETLLKDKTNNYIAKPNYYIYFKICDYNNLQTPKETQDFLIKALKKADTQAEEQAIYELLKTHKNICENLLKEHFKNV